MKFSSVVLVFLFLFIASLAFAEKEKISTWKCKDWEKVETFVERAENDSSTQSKVPVKPKVRKPIQQKIPNIEPEKVLCPKLKLNTIFLEPMFYMMYSEGTKRYVVAPGLGISYVRDLTDKFSLGFGVMYNHAVYGKFPNRTFNMYGGKIMLGIKF